MGKVPKQVYHRIWKYCWCLNNKRVRGTNPPCSNITYSWSSALFIQGFSVSAVSSEPQIQPTLVQHPQIQPTLVNTVVFTTEKNWCVSGPRQFNPILFKGQLWSQMWTQNFVCRWSLHCHTHENMVIGYYFSFQ